MSRVGETGVGEMGIGETGVGEMGVGETGPNLQYYIRYVILSVLTLGHQFSVFSLVRDSVLHKICHSFYTYTRSPVLSFLFGEGFSIT